MACIALTLAGIIALVATAFIVFVISVIRRLNASAIDGDDNHLYWPPGDMFDPHRRG